MVAIGQTLPVHDRMDICWEVHSKRPPDRPSTIWRMRYKRPHKPEGKPTRWVTFTEYFFTSQEVNDKIDWLESNECELLSVDQYVKSS